MAADKPRPLLQNSLTFVTFLSNKSLINTNFYQLNSRQVPVDLMQRLVTNSGLFVMQTEFSVYVLLRLWIYLIFHPNWDGSPQDAVMSSHKFFQVNMN
jgi:hypothetical protein